MWWCLWATGHTGKVWPLLKNWWRHAQLTTIIPERLPKFVAPYRSNLLPRIQNLLILHTPPLNNGLWMTLTMTLNSSIHLASQDLQWQWLLNMNLKKLPLLLGQLPWSTYLSFLYHLFLLHLDSELSIPKLCQISLPFLSLSWILNLCLPKGMLFTPSSRKVWVLFAVLYSSLHSMYMY